MTTPVRHRLILAAALATSLVGLAACGKKDDGKAASQVAAKVGSEEISVHQINQVLSRANTNGASQQAVQAMGREALEKLIDQQLAVAEATDNKLHRSPEVVSQIEAAKREILARAYIQQLTSALPKPSAEDVKKYYAGHPQLFAERRVFNLQEIAAPAADGVADTLRTLAASGKPMEEIANTLKAKGIQFNGGAVSRAAEQIPLEILPKVHAMRDGQSIVLENPQSATLLRLVSSQSAPVPEAAATGKIEQFLMNQRANEAISEKIKTLRAAAKITYLGDFAKPLEAAAAAPAPEAKSEAKAAVAPANSASAAIEKGVAGLK